MDINILKNEFTNFEFFDENKIFDHENKNYFIINTDFICIGNDYKEYIRKELISVLYKDYSIIGIVLLNISNIFEVEILRESILIMISRDKSSIELIRSIIKNIDMILFKKHNQGEYDISKLKDLNNIRKNLLKSVYDIDEILSNNFKAVIQSPVYENLYKELLFSEKISKKQLIRKYPDIISESSNLKLLISDAKKYFRDKKI